MRVVSEALKRVRRTVWVWLCACQRCGYKWTSTRVEPPPRCASCGAPNWTAAPRWRRPDRSKK